MNIATALKSEISRVSRKEVRTELQSLKKTTTKLRSDNADLKRRLTELEKLVKQLSKGSAKKAPAAGSQDEAGTVARFSGKGLAAQRKRLGLSAADFGKLIGVSGASVYLWEEGKTRPRAKHMPGIAAVRGMGKKDAAAKLGALR
ncbi:MAG: helix-turn-helix domain-containing protein [Pseudomonadota bacterium]